MDQHLYTTKGSPPNTVLWRPQNGSSVAMTPTDYRPISQVVRTVHLDDALDICVKHCMEPKPITSLSSLKNHVLRPYHPCKNLHVLWFGAKYDGTDEDAHDWYGNVEFAIPPDTLMQRWSNYYLVEMLTAPTHSITRILVTNSNYSKVLPLYNPHRYGGAWYITPEGRHMRLANCRRYNGEGYNRHGHTLEFMIEVTAFGMRKILEETRISFRNHENAAMNGPHVCHRFKGPPNCPAPFSRAYTSRCFFHEHGRLNAHQPMAKPRLSPSAEEFLKIFLTIEGTPRSNLLVLASPPCPPPCPPPFSHQHFPPLSKTIVLSQILQQRMDNGTVKKRHQMLGRDQDSVFRLIAESITKAKMHSDEEEEEKVVTAVMTSQRSHRKMPLAPPPGFHLTPPVAPSPGFFLPPPFGAPPGFFPLPPPLSNPPLHLPPPPLHLPPPPHHHPGLFQHSWAPLQPVTFRRRN